MRFVTCVLVGLGVLFSAGAACADNFERYRDPTPLMLTDYFFDSGMVKLSQDKDVLEYLQIKDCTVYTMAKEDIFLQRQMAQQMTVGQTERAQKFNKNLLIRLPGRLRITQYNFNTQSFDLLPDDQLIKVGVMVVWDMVKPSCNKKASTPLRVFPENYVVKLNLPISLYRLPMQSKAAKSLYESLDNSGTFNASKVVYTWVYVSIEGALPGVTRDKKRGVLLGQVDTIDVFQDAYRTKRLKRLDYRETY